jgi:hypothetical protein
MTAQTRLTHDKDILQMRSIDSKNKLSSCDVQVVFHISNKSDNLFFGICTLGKIIQTLYD